MIELLESIVSFIAGIIACGFGFSVMLAGIKIMFTGLGWLI